MSIASAVLPCPMSGYVRTGTQNAICTATSNVRITATSSISAESESQPAICDFDCSTA